MKPTIHGNRFAMFVATFFALIGIIGLVCNFYGIWIPIFGTLIALSAFFVYCAAHIRLVCTEDGFSYRGISNKVVRHAFSEIAEVIFTPIVFMIVFENGEKLKIPSICVTGIRTFVNVAKIEKIKYR